MCKSNLTVAALMCLLVAVSPLVASADHYPQPFPSASCASPPASYYGNFTTRNPAFAGGTCGASRNFRGNYAMPGSGPQSQWNGGRLNYPAQGRGLSSPQMYDPSGYYQPRVSQQTDVVFDPVHGDYHTRSSDRGVQWRDDAPILQDRRFEDRWQDYGRGW